MATQVQVTMALTTVMPCAMVATAAGTWTLWKVIKLSVNTLHINAMTLLVDSSTSVTSWVVVVIHSTVGLTTMCALMRLAQLTHQNLTLKKQPSMMMNY